MGGHHNMFPGCWTATGEMAAFKGQAWEGVEAGGGREGEGMG